MNTHTSDRYSKDYNDLTADRRRELRAVAFGRGAERPAPESYSAAVAEVCGLYRIATPPAHRRPLHPVWDAFLAGVSMMEGAK